MEGNFEGNGINIRTVTYDELEPYEKELDRLIAGKTAEKAEERPKKDLKWNS